MKKFSGKLINRVLFLAAVLPVTAFAQSGVDLHWLWDDRCASCHGHSSEFSRQYLRLVDGNLQGIHHTEDLLLFLKNHYLRGQFSDEIYAMLLAQVGSPGRFKNECSGCHQTASGLVRGALLVREGELTVRKSGQSLRLFLENHRHLNDEDVVFYVDLLTRIAVEVNLKE